MSESYSLAAESLANKNTLILLITIRQEGVAINTWGPPSGGSQVPSPNMEAKSQLLKPQETIRIWLNVIKLGS